jgi:uncharacterized protein
VAFVGNRAMKDLTEKLAQGHQPPTDPPITDFLREIGFLDPDPPAPKTVPDRFRPNNVVLLLTNQCQLRCIYCYAAAGEQSRHELSEEVGKAAIDYVIQQAKETGQDSIGISLHGGGEPTLAWKVIQRCTEYARSQPIRADISLTSNGLWSQKKLDWIVANLNGVTISMDGGRETQNRQRPLRSGKGSAAFALRTVAALDARGFPYGIRMTATTPWSNLPEDVRFLCSETQCKTIQVEPAFNTGRKGHRHPEADEGEAYTAALLEAYEIAEQANRSFYYAGTRVGQVTDAFCTAPYNALMVTPLGDIVTCYEVTDPSHDLADISTIGRVVDGVIKIDDEARSRLLNLIYERRAGCRGCFCYWSCAGSCYTRTFQPGPGGHQYRAVLCDVTRTVTRELLLKRIAQADGVWSRQWDHVRRELPVAEAGETND